MGLKEIETPNAMISYFAEQLGPLIEKSEIKQPISQCMQNKGK